MTAPLRYDAGTDHFLTIGWDEAFAVIGAGLQALDSPNQAEFYCSGRASNEAAFLYQLFARAFGTNNFPDCSNMCHEATSVGLPVSIGVGKGTVTLEDFDMADAIFCIGHSGQDWHDRFALLTSRCSYELVEKVVLAGCSTMVTISARTSIAIERAREAGLSLYVLARPDRLLLATVAAPTSEPASAKQRSS